MADGLILHTDKTTNIYDARSFHKSWAISYIVGIRGSENL